MAYNPLTYICQVANTTKFANKFNFMVEANTELMIYLVKSEEIEGNQ